MERKSDFHMMFIYIEKTYDRVRKVLWCMFDEKQNTYRSMNTLKNMYEEVITCLKRVVGNIEVFLVSMGLY